MLQSSVSLSLFPRATRMGRAFRLSYYFADKPKLYSLANASPDDGGGCEKRKQTPLTLARSSNFRASSIALVAPNKQVAFYSCLEISTATV